MNEELFCGLSERHANIVLHSWLMTPLSAKQNGALAAALHFEGAASDPLVLEARALVRENAALPCDFTRSLNSCRLIEEKLTPSQLSRYCIHVERLIGSTHFTDDLILFSSGQRVRALLPALGLIKAIEETHGNN